MADPINDSEEESEVDNIGVEPIEPKQEVVARRFDPEALLTDEGVERDGDDAIYVDDMYGDWFLDYASYVILERAVPHADDGLKPVQRRILHSMRELEDGRYNKVANVIGNTMKYHPHGDTSIGDAMIQLGQKDLLIDMQGNWGNLLTGDSAAAPRYIEARLTPFALEVIFSPKVTVWASSYDGRNKEPVTFPVKFPILLAQGAEGYCSWTLHKTSSS
jgi:topoisomerase-4 subunit A